ncbi:hypothetical protein Ais01nite_16680 [Asanoa ishikariensis]|nr:hypothetical protein Ais01nite_16680 [Asanoa ishikariensis]
MAGAPANRQNYLATLSQGVREQQNRDASGNQVVDAAAAAVVGAAVVATCDGVVKDGVVDDPRTCRFDPAAVACPSGLAAPGCLSAAQVAVVKDWYDSPRDNRGHELYPGGLPVGSEGGWVGSDISTDPTRLSGGGAYAEQVLRYLAFPTDPGAGYTLFDFDPSRDAKKLGTMAKVYNADTTDLDAFRKAGGKPMLYHGLADPGRWTARSSSPGCSCCRVSTTATVAPAPTGSTGRPASATGPSGARRRRRCWPPRSAAA